MFQPMLSPVLSRGWIAIALLIVGPLLVLGLGRQGSHGSPFPQVEQPSGAPAAARREVRLGYFPNLTHAQAVLGASSGEFEQAVAPAVFTTRTFNAGSSLIEALFAREIDVGYVGPAPALNAHLRSRGRGIRVVAGAASNGVVIVVRSGAGIETLEDLKGKRIATPQLGNTQDLSARHYLIKQLGQENANNVLPVPNAETISLMARGRIDAAWTVEPWAARLVAEAEGVVLAEERDLWPSGDVGLTVIVTTPEFIEREPELLGRILHIHAMWTERLAADPNSHLPQLAAALEQLTGKRLPDDVLQPAISRLRFGIEPPIESLETFARWSAELGFSRSIANVDSLLDMAPLERLKATRASAAVEAAQK
jgi:NitT/TauT family transport system substrate-binding protein